MSRENVEIMGGVRTPLVASTRPRPRTLDERILVRFPALVGVLGSVCRPGPDCAEIEHAEVIDFGDRVLAAGRMKGHGTISGISVDEPLFQLLTLRGGMVVRQEDFVDRNRALEAAGLSD